MNIKRCRHLLIVCFILLLYSPNNAYSIKLPFFYDEELKFDLSWYKVNAGTAILKVGDGGDNKDDTLLISSVVQSNKVFSLFFKVKDKVETIVDTELLYPSFLSIDQSEGKRKKKKRIYYDHEKNSALTHEFNKKKIKEKISPIVPFSHNSLSAFYYLRTVKSYNIGETIVIDVHEGGKNWKLEIEVLKREELKTKMGKFKTVKLKARVIFEGMFMDKGDVFVWISDDEKRLPLKIYCKISFGKVVATLINVKSN